MNCADKERFKTRLQQHIVVDFRMQYIIYLLSLRVTSKSCYPLSL